MRLPSSNSWFTMYNLPDYCLVDNPIDHYSIGGELGYRCGERGRKRRRARSWRLEGHVA